MVILKNRALQPWTINLPGQKAAVHLAPRGMEGAETAPLDVSDCGPDAEVLRRRGFIDVIQIAG